MGHYFFKSPHTLDNKILFGDSSVLRVALDMASCWCSLKILFRMGTGIPWTTPLVSLSDFCQHCTIYLWPWRYQKGFGFSSVWWRTQKPRWVSFVSFGRTSLRGGEGPGVCLCHCNEQLKLSVWLGNTQGLADWGISVIELAVLSHWKPWCESRNATTENSSCCKPRQIFFPPPFNTPSEVWPSGTRICYHLLRRMC